MMLRRLNLGLAVALGLLSVANSLFMLAAPQLWYDTVPGVPDEGPFNQHFVRDIGLAFLLVGICFLAGARRPRLRTGLWSAGAFWLTGHALFHLWQVFAGMSPPSTLLRDFPAVSLPALIGLTLACWSWRNEHLLAGLPIRDAITRPTRHHQPG